MSRFALDPDLEPAAALLSAARAETERAQQWLARGDASGIHEMRKSCKRLRALARLLRDAHTDLDAPGQALNAWLRAAADAVGGLRNAEVAVQSFAALQRPADIGADAWTQLGAQLQAERKHLGTTARARQAEAASALQRTAQLLAELKLPALRPADLRQAAQRMRKRCRRAYRAAQADPRPLCLHEWRKKAKRLGYQLDLLDGYAPDDKPSAKALKPLGEVLGEHHDLHALELCLQAQPDRHGGELLLWRLHELLQAHARPLERRALALGEELFG